MFQALKTPRNLTAALVFFVSFLIYFLTMAQTTSFWDCGEFIACSYTLGVPHPPGSPLYILAGRIFSLLPTEFLGTMFMSKEELNFIMPEGVEIAWRVNLMSPLMSAFSAMFAFLIIVRLIEMWQGKADNFEKKIMQYASGAIGALAFAFSDSQWFNSVESEVYSAALFFTAIVVWLVLRWSEESERMDSDKWLVIIFYLIGLALGVHLLNLLALPTVFLIMYLRKRSTGSLGLGEGNEFGEFGGLVVGGLLGLGELGLAALIGGLFQPLFEGVPIFGELPVVPGILTAGFLYLHYTMYKSAANEKSERLHASVSFTLGALLSVGIVYPGIVKGVPQMIEISFYLVGLVLLGLVAGIWNAVKKQKRELGLALMCILMIFVGYSTYSVIYVRSGLNPVIDENAPDTPEKFVSYLNREQYGDWEITNRRAPVWEYQIKKMFIRYFGWQFIGKGTDKAADGTILDTISFNGLWGLPFLLGLFGFAHHFIKDWRRALSILILFIATGIAIVVYLNQEDPQPRERDYAYTGAFFAFALWIGIGMSFVLELVRDAFKEVEQTKRLAMGVVSLVVLLAVPGRMLAFNYHDHSRQGNFVAYDYSKNILETCEPNAIIFTNGDNDTFPLWFLQTVYGIRTDVRIVNLSLLNTNWYIKQLRDEEPKVPISLTDRQIDELAPQAWKTTTRKIPVPRDVRRQWIQKIQSVDSTFAAPDQDFIELTIQPTLFGQGIRVQDIMILRLLIENQFKRPIYFAVTVADNNKVGLQDFLQMDGLAFKVLPVKVDRRFIDPEVIEKNLTERYDYRNLDNAEVYYNDNILALLGNYRSAYLSLVEHYRSNNQKENALAALDHMEEVMPEEVIPPTNWQISMFIGQIYNQLGRPEEYKKRVDKLVDAFPLEQRLQFLDVYLNQLKDLEGAKSLAQSVLDDENIDLKTKSDIYNYLVSHYVIQGKADEGLELTRKWLELDPTNTTAQSRLRTLEAQAAPNAIDSAANQ